MSKRITKIQDTYYKDIINKVKEQGYDLSHDDIWNTILNADHTQNNKNVRWIVETFLINGFLWEDIESGKDSKVYETIKLFDRLKHNIENINNRSLIQYKNLGSLYASIMPYLKKSKNEIKEEEKAKMYQETEIFFEKDGLKILSPKTMEAAQYWGRGTRWCTSAENNNLFSRYNENSPLIIIITPEGHKFQAWKDVDSYNGTNIQFMNELDINISDTELEDNWQYFKPISYYLNNLSAFPEMAFSIDMKKELCIKEPYMFLDLINTYEDTDVNDGFIIDVIKQNPSAMDVILNISQSYIKNSFHDRLIIQLCQNPEFIRTALQIDMENIKHIENLAEEYDVVNINSTLNDIFNEYPLEKIYPYIKHTKTKEMSEQAFHKDNMLIKYINKEHQTASMIEELYQSTSAQDFLKYIEYINPDLITEMQLITIMNESSNMEFFEYQNALKFLAMTDKFDKLLSRIINNDLADTIASSEPSLFQGLFVKIPDEYKTYDRYMMYLQNNSHNNILDFIPDHIIDQNMIETTIKAFYKNNEYSIYHNNKPYLPEQYNTPENTHLIEIYQHQTSKNYIIENKDKLTQEQWNEVITKMPKLLLDVPEQFQTEELWRYVSNYNTSALKKLPEKYRTLEFIRSLDYTKYNILLHALIAYPNLPYTDIKDIIDKRPKEVIHLPNDYPMTQAERTRYIVKAIDMDNELFFTLPDQYKTVEIFQQIDKDSNLLDYLERYDEQDWYEHLTDDEKISLYALNYNPEDVYNNIRECLKKHPPVISVKKENDYSYPTY